MSFGLFVVVTPLLLRARDQDFFRIPYITWYLLHYTIAGLGVIGVLILALTGTITGEVISALLGSLFGYVLGSTSARAGAQTGLALAITTPSPLPNGTVGTAYSQRLAASGGTPPYAWSVSLGTLPAGLTLNAGSGVISGTPTAAGSTTFAVHVADSANATASKLFTITIG